MKEFNIIFFSLSLKSILWQVQMPQTPEFFFCFSQLLKDSYSEAYSLKLSLVDNCLFLQPLVILCLQKALFKLLELFFSLSMFSRLPFVCFGLFLTSAFNTPHTNCKQWQWRMMSELMATWRLFLKNVVKETFSKDEIYYLEDGFKWQAPTFMETNDFPSLSYH